MQFEKILQKYLIFKILSSLNLLKYLKFYKKIQNYHFIIWLSIFRILIFYKYINKTKSIF